MKKILLIPAFVLILLCLALAVVVGKVAKSSVKALVKPFCEKNFTEFLARVEKMVSVFLSFPRHYETLFELKNSEFCYEIKF